MATQAQIEANRLNARKSTGPSAGVRSPSDKTPEGKACAALNALKHGIRANALVASLARTPLFDDDPQEFSDLVQSLVDQFHPQGPYEAACVEDIAICQWRLRRIVIAETGHIASAQTILLSGPGADNPRLRQRNALPCWDSLEKLNRYETSIQRQLKRSFDALTSLIRERSSGDAQADPRAQAPQADHQQQEIDSIRREVLGYLTADLSSRGNDPELASLSHAHSPHSTPASHPSPGARHTALDPVEQPDLDETQSAQANQAPTLASPPFTKTPTSTERSHSYPADLARVLQPSDVDSLGNQPSTSASPPHMKPTTPAERTQTFQGGLTPCLPRLAKSDLIGQPGERYFSGKPILSTRPDAGALAPRRQSFGQVDHVSPAPMIAVPRLPICPNEAKSPIHR